MSLTVLMSGSGEIRWGCFVHCDIELHLAVRAKSKCATWSWLFKWGVWLDGYFIPTLVADLLSASS